MYYNHLAGLENVQGLYEYYCKEQETKFHKNSKNIICPKIIPFEKYRIYNKWLPEDRIEVLFIAESPPWSSIHDKNYRYFYNPDNDKIQGLSWYLFDYLNIKGQNKKDCLEKFKEKGFFLVDTIKCIFVKKDRKSIPKSLIEFSTLHFLKHEIINLNPKAIFVLGGTAFKGLQIIYPNELKQFNGIMNAIKNKKDLPMKINNQQLFFSCFPNSRNDQKAIKNSFKQLRLWGKGKI
jgi:hypothetical protein